MMMSSAMVRRCSRVACAAIIINTGSMEDLEQHVVVLDARYRSLTNIA